MEKIMATIQAKVLACFMGFAILSIFNVNNSFANDYNDHLRKTNTNFCDFSV
jgi:hypothetical protein